MASQLSRYDTDDSVPRDSMFCSVLSLSRLHTVVSVRESVMFWVSAPCHMRCERAVVHSIISSHLGVNIGVGGVVDIGILLLGTAHGVMATSGGVLRYELPHVGR